MKLLLFINQKNYYEEILIQIILTLETFGIAYTVDPLYSLLINVSFILIFLLIATHNFNISFLRFWYHHQFYIAIPIFMQSQNFQIISSLNVIVNILLAIFFLSYTEILGDIQTHKMLRIFKFCIIIFAFLIRDIWSDAQTITIIIYDAVVLVHTFLLGIVAYQDIMRLQISVLISFNRLIVLILFYFINWWKILFYLPVLIYISWRLLIAFLHQEIRIALRDSHFRLRQIVMIQFTYQLGLYPGLFYLSQVLVMHSKDCDRPDCFCTKKFSLTQEQTWKSPADVLKQSLNQILCEILRLYNWSQLKSCGEECLLLLCRIETEYRNDKLFETLLRSRYFIKDKQGIFKYFPHALRIQGHREMFYNKLLNRIKGVRLNSNIYFTYCELIEQLGQLIVKLLYFRQYILIMFLVQYQYPLYYLFDNKVSYYVEQIKKCETLMNNVLKINPHSNVSQHLLYAMYSMITFQFEKLKEKQTKFNLSNHQIDSLWDLLNDRQCCFVQCKYDNGLILINHSILFTQLIEENDIKSDYIGKYIDKLIANPIREIHETFLKRLITEGQPKLLNIGIQKFYIVTTKGFMKQIDSLVRLGSSMENLTFMTIMGYKLEDQCGQILLSKEGQIYQYNEQAANQLKLDKQFQHNEKIHLNLKICIPFVSSKNDLCNGLIIIPKTNLVSKDKLQKTISSKDINEISFYKYFLKHPKQCNIFVAAYKFSDSSLDKNNLFYETLFIYSCSEVKDIDYKMKALELMLKQVMLTNNVQSESYVTSYTTFKSIVPSIYKNSNSAHSPTIDNELDDRNFIISNESIHIQQDPQSFPIYQFVSAENQMQQELDQQNEQKSQNHQVNYSSMIANSFQTQDLLFSSRRINEDLSARDNKNENQVLLKQQIMDNPEQWIHQQKLVDDYEEPESPEEIQLPETLQISTKDMNEKYIQEQLEQIKSQVKIQKQQINKQTKFQSTDLKQKKFHKITLDRQPSSIKSTDSQKGLINHIVNGMIKSGTHQFYSLIFIALIYMIALIILIVLSIISLEKQVKQLYLDTIGGQFSITLLQDYNLILIAINVLSSQPSFQAAKFYIQNSTLDYSQFSSNVNNKQNINYQFLKNLDYQKIQINHSFSNNGQYEFREFYTRRYLVDSLPLLFFSIQEKAEQNVNSFNITHMEESYFTFNYPTFFQLAISLIEETEYEIYRVKEETMNIALIYVIAGFCTFLLISLIMGIAELKIAKWRIKIVRTFFLFQNLQQTIINQEIEIQKLLEIDELKHIKYNIMKQDKNSLLTIKQDQRIQDEKLKKKFWAKHIISLLLFSTLELLYFIPYYSFFLSNVNELISFHTQIYTLGLAQLAFSNRLVNYIQLYTNPFNNIDEITFQKYDLDFSNYEDELLFQIPQDEQQDPLTTSYIINNNICELNSVQKMLDLGYQCPFILQDGLSKFIISTTNQFNVLKQEYNNFTDGLQQVLNDSEFYNVIIAYGFVFPQFNYYRDILFQQQDSINSNQKIQTILMALLVLIAIIILFLITISFTTKSFYKLIITVKRSLLIFSKDQIAKNKHLVQVLSREVTFD